MRKGKGDVERRGGKGKGGEDIRDLPAHAFTTYHVPPSKVREAMGPTCPCLRCVGFCLVGDQPAACPNPAPPARVAHCHARKALRRARPCEPTPLPGTSHASAG